MPGDILEGFSLSPQQRRLWRLQQVERGMPYLARCAVRIDGALDAALLAAALRQVVDRYEILRTTFRQLPGMTTPLQVIAERADPALQEHDLGGLDSVAQAQAVAAIAGELSLAPFDLAGGPLLRCALARLASDRHVLLIALPSLCADAPALANLAGALSRAYAACARGEALDDEPIQYADLAAWQNELQDADDAAAGRTYWQQQDFAARADAQLFERRPERAGFAPRVIDVRLPAEAGDGHTSEAFWLACWQILLRRLSSRADLIVGVGGAGRQYDELAGALGLFVRYLPIGAAISANQPLAEYLPQLRDELNTAFGWQECFSWELAGQAGADAPFFALCFDFDEWPAPVRAAGLTFSLERRQVCADRFALKLVCVRRDERVAAELHYDAGAIAEADAARLAEQFAALVADARRRPNGRLEEFEVLSQRERQLLAGWNATQTDYPRELGVHKLFAGQARRTPDAVAVVFDGTKDEGRTTNDEGRTTNDERDRGEACLAPGTGGACPAPTQHLTFRALNARANQLARHLQTLGVGPDVCVGLRLPRSPEMVIAVLGVLKAGGAYLPIDPAYPAERLDFMLADSGAWVLITTNDERRTTNDERSTADCWLPTDKTGQPVTLPPCHLVTLEADWPAIARQPDGEPIDKVAPANLAYVIYTSGSTGQPKGTMITHQGLSNYLSWCLTAYDLSAGRGAPVHSPLGFDLTVTSLFAPLLAGRAVTLLPEQEGAGALGAALQGQQDWSLVKLTPAHLELLSRQLAPAAARHARALVIGGEALRAEQLAFWRANAPGVRLFNEYGPTETVVGCCVYEVPPGNPLPQALPIGRPIANTQLYVLDAQGRQAPIGVAGELAIGGDGLARGYLNRPELTAERFIPNPFPTNDERRTTNGTLPTANCRLRTAKCRLPTADCIEQATWRAIVPTA